MALNQTTWTSWRAGGTVVPRSKQKTSCPFCVWRTTTTSNVGETMVVRVRLTLSSTACSTIEGINTQATLTPTLGPSVFAQPLFKFNRAYFDMSTTHQGDKTTQLKSATEANERPTTQREVVTAIQNVVKGGLASSCTLVVTTDIGTRSSLTCIRSDEGPRP